MSSERSQLRVRPTHTLFVRIHSVATEHGVLCATEKCAQSQKHTERSVLHAIAEQILVYDVIQFADINSSVGNHLFFVRIKTKLAKFQFRFSSSSEFSIIRVISRRILFKQKHWCLRLSKLFTAEFSVCCEYFSLFA